MIIMGSKVNTSKHTKSETINWAHSIINISNNTNKSSSTRKCNQSVIKSADCCVKSRKKDPCAQPKRNFIMLLCHNFIYFFEWKIVFYNLIWSFNRDVALVFFHLCFAINSIVFTQRRHRAFLSPEIRFNYVTDTHKRKLILKTGWTD